MSKKRSRNEQSPSLLLERWLHPELRWRSAFSSEGSQHQHQSSRSLFSVPSPPREASQQNRQSGYFLERCYYCKKSLNLKENVYMYGDFTAFCAPECCDAQFRMDQAEKKVHGQSPGKST
ncbi:hypothetical protein K2173_018492 [Erythroxylum novogranatense]|uniref:FLZ-type domain-containing protein n=1 Tax=Erythroxylum novogranatense TaxID=1862640 RepID=A0AAV8UD95_9ROSI|nr:hypothetical protein K2173_018492 [Erythroxylum novogranatense]